MAAKAHEHVFTALAYHPAVPGTCGRESYRDVHVHACWDEDCDRVVVGIGRCADRHHYRDTLPLDDARVARERASVASTGNER
jgi:hypothetical protein